MSKYTWYIFQFTTQTWIEWKLSRLWVVWTKPFTIDVRLPDTFLTQKKKKKKDGEVEWKFYNGRGGAVWVITEGSSFGIANA